MEKKKFEKPFIEKIDFDPKQVIATSGECYESVINLTQQSPTTCSGGNPMYIGWTNDQTKA